MILPSDNKRKGSVTLLATIIFLQINTLQQTCNVICNKIEEKLHPAIPHKQLHIQRDSRLFTKKMLQDQPEFGGRKGDPKRGKA